MQFKTLDFRIPPLIASCLILFFLGSWPACTANVETGGDSSSDSESTLPTDDFSNPNAENTFTQVAGCSEIQSTHSCVEVTACQDLTNSDQYYLLVQDVSANGTCFQIRAGNFVFDLNGHTIYYAQSQTGHAFHDEWTNQDNITIKNGAIEGGHREESHALYFQSDGSDDLVIDTLDVSAGGLQTEGLIFQTGSNLTVHSVYVSLDSQKEDPCSHYGGHIAGISLSNSGGKIEIHNCSVVGNGMLGITASDCATFSEPMLIHDNYVQVWSPVRDGYAIGISSRDNRCSDGTKVYDNVIDQENGRGIAVAGWDVGSDHGPGNVEVYGNKIRVKEGWDCEYDAAGTGTGIRIRFGAHDISVHDNRIVGLAGTGVATGSHPTKDGAKTIGLYLGSSSPHGENNRYENNYIDVSTNNPDFPAIGVYVGGGSPENKSLPSIFTGNTFKSNHEPIRVGFSDGCGYNALFESNTIIQGNDPLEFRSIGLGYWKCGATGITFLDTLFETGASVYDMEFYPCSGSCDGYPPPPFEDIYISWTLRVEVERSSGGPAAGASVQIRDSDSQIQAEGSTDTTGIFSAGIPEKSFEGINEGIETDHNPYSISVTYGGDTQNRTDISVTEPGTESFTF